MRHFPIYRDLRDRRVILTGGGEVALAKLRLLLRTEALLTVHAADPAPEIDALAAEGRLTLVRRPLGEGDAEGAALVWCAEADDVADAAAAAIGRRAGALVNIVDNLDASDFLTPALVDRDPVVVAIGTEGAAPVLARSLKARIEEMLPPATGTLARLAAGFRGAVEALPPGRARRAFWTRFFDGAGPRAHARGGEEAVKAVLPELLTQARDAVPAPGRVALVGAGPGDPELLTLRARLRLHEADVVIYDRLVAPAILELARREAVVVEVGKTPGGPSWPQERINALMVEHAARGAQVVRLKAGDPGVFGRLDEELDALDGAGIGWEIVPGITAAAAAAAEIGQSLTRRGRNGAVTLMTARDRDGPAEQDWRALAAPGAVAAVYMGVRAARFLQGRLMLHGADPATPVTAVENAGRPDRREVATRLDRLPAALAEAGVTGPAILFLGLAPRAAAAEPLPAVGVAS
jgi:uroporphyrin-III C-methyltransferase/precorrin-2 dehydrogenase/sirohydrochlorin ferrochelatase